MPRAGVGQNQRKRGYRWYLASKCCQRRTTRSPIPRARWKRNCGFAALLTGQGFQIVHPRAFETNVVFDTPDRQLRGARRLLRVREFGGVATLTYKGTPETGRHKSREELEIQVADAETLRTILGRLGYARVFRYEKFRTVFERPGETGQAVLDETPIGCWIELEGAPEWIDENAARLGFTHEQYSTESYGALWLAHCREHGIDSLDMVFSGDPA
jgi:adenylate cyclase class 2